MITKELLLFKHGKRRMQRLALLASSIFWNPLKNITKSQKPQIESSGEEFEDEEKALPSGN
jgi:hypothetical protein